MATLDKSFLETDLYKNAEAKTYTSLIALSIATGVPKKLLTQLKKIGCSGFNANGTVNWAKAKIPFEQAVDSLEAKASDDLSYWNKENKKKDVAIKELQIKKLERNLIEPEDVQQLMVELATIQSTVLNSVFTELPPKLSGKSEIDIRIILESSLEQIYTVIKQKMDTWK